MPILNVQTMANSPQERLDRKTPNEPRAKTLGEKNDNFSRYLQNMSPQELKKKSGTSINNNQAANNKPLDNTNQNINEQTEKAKPKQGNQNYQADTLACEESKSNQTGTRKVSNANELGKQCQDKISEMEAALLGLAQVQEETTNETINEASITSAQDTAAGPSTLTPIPSQEQGAKPENMQQTAQNEPDPKAINPLPLATELNTVSALTETTSSVLETVQAPGSQGKDSIHANMNLTGDIGITEATVKTNPPPYNLLMPQLQNYENDTRKIVVPPTLSTANNLTAADNALLEQDSQQPAEKMSVIPNPQEHIAATPWDAESASKPDKNSGKHRIRMDLMAKNMGDQANQNTGVQTVGDAKKIMEIESHRLVNSKIPADNLLMDETAQEAGAEELKTLTNVDKILAELAKPSSETAKPQAANRGYTTVNPEEIAEQIVKKVEIMAKQASSEMKIQLKPEYLGKMMIQIIVDDGVITARFTTESQQVKQALESNMSILKQNLEANGMRVEKTEVNVQLDNGGNSNNGSEGNRQYLWQEMTGQGRDSNQYVQYNRDYFDDMPDLTTYQQGTDIPQLMHEGRLDFTI